MNIHLCVIDRCFQNYENGVRRGEFAWWSVTWGGGFQRTPTQRKPFDAAWRNLTDAMLTPMVVPSSSLYWGKGIIFYPLWCKIHARIFNLIWYSSFNLHEPCICPLLHVIFQWLFKLEYHCHLTMIGRVDRVITLF